MDSKKLEILMTAIDLGSFSKASEVVGYTQSGLTHLVDSLERDIGLTLVRRDHNGITLTREGETLVPSIREFLRANAKLENQIAAITDKKRDTIRVAAYASIAMHWMPEILYRFRRVCPNTDVDLRMVDNALEPFELLEKGRTDVIFAAKQTGYSCDWTPLCQDAMYAILPPEYPLGEMETFPIELFEGKEFLMPYGRFDLDVKAALDKNGVKPRIRPCHVDDETVIRMVGKGLGLSKSTLLTAEELEIMCRAENIGKVSRRDVAVYVALGRTGATTVASTMIIAAMAGIPVFATGGIGGVHRGGQDSMDISADLQELAHTPVTVVCAGAKQILDIGRTLEYLETMGVPVIGNQTADFPAFFCRKSGFGVDYAAQSEAEIASIIHAQRGIGFTAGILVGNPVPEEYALDHEYMERIINVALQAADEANVHGKNITPFLLAKVKELTGGESFETNVQLALNNARCAARIAAALCELKKAE